MRTSFIDAQVAEALAVPIASELHANILNMTLRRLQRRRRLLAVGASLLVGSATVGYLSFERNDPMALAGIDFVIEEESSAILAAAPPDPAMLTRAVNALQIELPPQLGNLRYIGTCPFQGTIAHHVIATTPLGKVTLLLLPDQRIERPKYADARGLYALVRGAGDGSIAMIGESRRSLERVCRFALIA